MKASEAGHLQTVKYLVKNGARIDDYNIKCKFSITTLNCIF